VIHVKGHITLAMFPSTYFYLHFGTYFGGPIFFSLSSDAVLVVLKFVLICLWKQDNAFIVLRLHKKCIIYENYYFTVVAPSTFLSDI